ncbi:wall-associated receptor kinase-like 2 [Beta vulgaris subsp. vulgaris]|uniref:wall-associated receptor kinase-like 2 n=1 Tax=Beta vulgaris subsp. vulgaris TaxID=3555 RepID=UPI00053FE04F|nr:wall-associated receptor kinase-like 2 [Beta vulgaris subsp. vulgaris]
MAIVSSAVKASANAGLLVVAIGGLLEIWLAVATPRIAKPGCEDRCGNVSIPYPFGIGPNCYHNPWFDVECWLESDGFLMKWTTELDFIISGSQINWDPVKGERTFVTTNPCHGFCISRESDDTSHLMEKPSYNLTGSPFLFSRKRNVLLVSGCGGGVLLRNKNMQTVAGCAAVCINRSAPGKECYGVGCCQTTFSYSIDYYDFEFVNMALARPTNDLSYSSPCTYAVLVDSTWIINKSKDINFSNYDNEICGQGEANVVLEWTVTDLPIQSPSYANSSCVYKTASVDDAGGYICRCREEFFEGNPYLPYGCQVVSECEDCVQECISLGNHTFGCPQKAEKVNTTSIALGLGLGISFVVFLVLFGVYWLYHMLKRRRNIRLKAMYFEKNGGLLLKQQLPSEEGDNIFTSDELEKATDQYNEDRVLGQGGQGTVYKGMLSDGKIVAIKKSKIVDESQLSVFINEVVILSQINHRNVVRLLGCCLETEVPMLVYEYVPNGTLSESIHGLKEDFPITWEMRLQIGTNIANALSYLHSSYLIPIYHRDIKSSNILLDTNYRAKLSDFGISKALGIDQTHITTQVVGTFGYLDPEYFQSNQFTDKSDVYSFGVVLVELLSGQKAIRVIDDEERGLVAWFLGHMEDSSLYDILDARVIREGEEDEIMMVAHLAKRCVNLDGKRRPTMKEVAAELETVRSSLQHGLTRNQSVLSNDYDHDQLPSLWIDSTT